jgi:hypothetical protein
MRNPQREARLRAYYDDITQASSQELRDLRRFKMQQTGRSGSRQPEQVLDFNPALSAS